MKRQAPAILRPARLAPLFVVASLAVAACDDSPAPGDPAVTAEASLEDDTELELTVASEGRVEGSIVVDGEAIAVSVDTNGTTRELVVTGLDEYARWVFDTETELTIGHIDAHTFGHVDDRFHSLDREYWDEMRQSRAAALLPVVSDAARRYASHDLDDATKAALNEVTRIAGYVDNLGVLPPELEGEAMDLPIREEVGDAGTFEEAVARPELDLTATTDPSAACTSQVSAAGHSITSVQVFQDGCRINHRSFTNKPNGGCNFSRCVQHFNSAGGSASSAYCNNPSQTLDQAHVTPRTGASYGLWSHHWAAGTALDAWYWKAAVCPG